MCERVKSGLDGDLRGRVLHPWGHGAESRGMGERGCGGRAPLKSLSRAHPSSLQASEEHKEEEGAHQVLSHGGRGHVFSGSEDESASPSPSAGVCVVYECG